ncbi:MAG TPA: hypothetical protein PKC60_10960 [Hydrogenophaga sp.]|uniref:hypothetical protein n=1 Tax=Hydrogenophaga sp. TaxID=1904254 RepID=UPI002CEC0E9E|nr:hypothetical protein [Hydrogenophaga sp.]HMN93735.1 hypothetical protein [Hydrogenophaga sp.]HMP09903.1 hypothetical protein [Hydrogenophaga sp.]
MTTDLSRYVPDGVTWIRAAVSCIPMVGGALDHLIFDKADAIRLKNLEAAIQAISDQVKAAGEDSIDKSWFESTEALATFKIMSDKVSYESDPAKVDAIGRIVAACGNKAHSEDREKISVVEHLSRLSAVQIKLLSVIANIPPTQKKISTGSLEQTAVAIWLSDIIAALRAGPQFWSGTLTVDQELEVLESFNTIRRVQLMGPSEAAYVVTAIGKRAASYAHTAGL